MWGFKRLCRIGNSLTPTPASVTDDETCVAKKLANIVYIHKVCLSRELTEGLRRQLGQRWSDSSLMLIQVALLSSSLQTRQIGMKSMGMPASWATVPVPTKGLEMAWRTS